MTFQQSGEEKLYFPHSVGAPRPRFRAMELSKVMRSFTYMNRSCSFTGAWAFFA
jgi:hypothetical protein